MEGPKKIPYNLPSEAVWFITGCSSGLGKSLSQHVIAQGGRLVATARNPSTLSYLPDGPSTLKLALDVTSPASIDAAIGAAVARFGRLDVVVNNAGYLLSGDTENATDADARRSVDTNFWGVVDVTKRAIGVMRDTNPGTGGGQQGGVIMNVTSLGGRVGFPGSAFYNGAKFAVEGFTESVWLELRPEWNVNVCTVQPGAVKTDFVSRSTQKIAPHPAYAAADSPTRVLEGYMNNPDAALAWADAEVMVACMYEVVARGQVIPLRVPLGPDTWGLLKADAEKTLRLLEECKELAL
ncbi:short-chain dehydrogenase, partial [Bombardia bombarda]